MEIERYLVNDTSDYDPCLPMPFSAHNESYISITFDESIITMDQWLPRNICEHNQTYCNQFLFYGLSGLILNNLIINNYSITNNHNYPFIYLNPSKTGKILQLNDCIFKEITSSISSEPLITTGIQTHVKDSKFIDVSAMDTIIVVQDKSEHNDPLLSIQRCTFNRIEAPNIIHLDANIDTQDYIQIEDSYFTSINLTAAIIHDDSPQSNTIIVNSYIATVGGEIYTSNHGEKSSIIFNNNTLHTNQLYDSSKQLFVFEIVDLVIFNMSTIIYTYDKSVST